MATPADCMRRIAITALSAQVGSGGVSNFDVLLTRADLPDEMCSPTDGNRAQSDGGDISFASDEAGTTQLACDIIRWEYDSSDGAGDAVISVRVNVASLSSASDTIFYGFYSTVGTSSQPAAGATYGQHATYHSSIVGYWALEEDPSGSAPQMLDRTSNANHGTSAGSMTSGDSVVAKVGNGLDFDGSDDRIDCGTDASLSPGDSFAIEAWVQSNTASGIAVSKRSAASARFWELGFDISGQSLFRITANSNDFGQGSTDLRHASTMNYIAGDYDGSNKSTYVNGSSVHTASMAGSADNSDAFEIGRRGYTGAEANWSGKVDEVRYSDVGRGQAYFTTRYNNESGSLISIATPVANSLSFTAQARGSHTVLNSFTAQARGRYTLGLLSFIAQQRGQSAILNSLTATTRGAHAVTAAFAAVTRGYHKVGIETFSATTRGQHAIVNAFTAAARGAHGVLTDFTGQTAGRHTIYEAFTGQTAGRHTSYEAFTAKARGQHSVLMSISTNYRGLHRIANDALARYELYRGVDALPEVPPDVPTATPWETFTGSSHTTAALTPPVSGTRTYYFVLRKRNAYDLSSQNTSAWSVTIDDTGAIVATPPRAPIDITLDAQASGVMLITARYLYTTDAPGDVADRFAIWLTSDGTDPDADNDPATATATFNQADGIGKLRYTTSGYADGTTIKVIVRMRRSVASPGANIDSTNTAILEADAIAVGPDAVTGAGVFFGHVARQEQ